MEKLALVWLALAVVEQSGPAVLVLVTCKPRKCGEAVPSIPTTPRTRTRDLGIVGIVGIPHSKFQQALADVRGISARVTSSRIRMSIGYRLAIDAKHPVSTPFLGSMV